MEKNLINQTTNRVGVDSNKILQLVNRSKPLTIDAVDGTLFFFSLGPEINRLSIGEYSVIGDYSEKYDVNKQSMLTEKTFVDIYDLNKDCLMEDTFKSLGSNLDELCLTQHQIINFLFLNKKRICWRRQTYVPFKIDNNYFYVSIRKCNRNGGFIPMFWFGVFDNISQFYKMDNPRILVRHI